MNKLPKLGFIFVTTLPALFLLDKIFLNCKNDAFGGFYYKVSSFVNDFFELPLVALFVLGMVLTIISIFAKNKTTKDKKFITFSFIIIFITLLVGFLVYFGSQERRKDNRSVARAQIASIQARISLKTENNKKDFVNTSDCYQEGSLFDDVGITNILKSNSNSKIKPRCFSDGKNWAVSIQLPEPANDGLLCSYEAQVWCTDSSGFLNSINQNNINSPSCTNLN